MATIVSDLFTGDDPSTIFSDTFTEAVDKNLEAHTPDTGTSWTELWATTAGTGWNVIAASDDAQQDTATDKGAIYTANATYPSPDYSIRATVTFGPFSVTHAIYLLLRIQDVDNMYAVAMNRGGFNQIYVKVAGVWTALGSTFTRPASGSVVEFEVHDNVLTVFDDGVIVASAIDSQITAAGKAGIGCGGGTELVNSTDDLHPVSKLDILKVVNVSTVGSHTPDVGGDWEVMRFNHGGGSTQTAAAIIKTNRIRATRDNQSSHVYRNAADPATAEYDVSADITLDSTTNSPDWTLQGRMTATGDFAADVDRYYGSYHYYPAAGDKQFFLRKYVADVLTNLASSVEDIGAGTFNLKLELRDAAKKVYLDGVEKLTSADNVITQIGRGGLTAPSNNADARYMDNYLVATPPPPAAFVPKVMMY